MELEQLPMVQKTLIQQALRSGSFTITATEMLESMVHSSRPTRAEVTDVANAVLDGTDAVMLSAETAVGKLPGRGGGGDARIARAVEASQRYLDLPRVGFRASEPTFSNAVALAAAQAAEALGVEHIICFTETGNTPRQLSRYRPHAEIFALSPHGRTLRHMSVLAHVRADGVPAQAHAGGHARQRQPRAARPRAGQVGRARGLRGRRAARGGALHERLETAPHR
jgi:pyruvate kinase